ncbi:MAG: 50S ribosomal protein L5 [Candidatus Doudnabacteria bacterium RIFCSPHIGHO2_02_FULL_48_21]|uniref:Large ribosomal subunit protein uL5 n=1 Tax=Candidatus Doudnabacteria bacterium RIFCSPLOWO2_02_FULL_48_13 TaxID=1817845 RepID=A0A1F5QCA6_9BACT|nr:ribosomal protein L5 [uncultured bacterium]OGE76248.1 MAG: 50S ribosomal protein L5 [Candidatus Doudnabacteria bacterium RIFCSPHIGHO2_01_48_18]OGE77519.1 MAG: 50S ribosomal protein L5 [Candidatus Doudnabacteria bacterium RIFCSPHIGHO2_01_FULL_48_180]OGE91660.1 MAG: 50S ribosomal protein L5 [Candidatus Doudnabacteria bacterium RIFCSPHIGHO2_12_FULL_47_25]OGE93354.1 MAG: 50S ribosomal protein L5 [Candidatus Doudnabacteria bacterium RIFCSPHIGHO2_02_FULL_48_21]OGE97438.1 MAG: 50S ribosomal protei
MTRLQELYNKQILPALKTELKIDNIQAVPRIQKIVINAGIGRILQQNPKALDALVETMRKITGQQPVITKASKAIAGFKIRQGQTVGLTVTLRQKRMYDFLDKFINVVMPRTRDFRGLSPKGFDGRGNYNCGVKEVLVFPETGEGAGETSFGLEVTIVTTAKNNEEGFQLLKKFGFPFATEEVTARKAAK